MEEHNLNCISNDDDRRSDKTDENRICHGYCLVNQPHIENTSNCYSQVDTPGQTINKEHFS